MPTKLSDAELHRLARLGALARLKELEEEAAAIRKAFPELKGAQVPEVNVADADLKSKAKRRRRKMSPEAREAARARMKAYWARKRG